MTTLPQTTAIRLPRVQSSSQLAASAGQAMIAAPSAGAGQMTAADVWRVLRAHLWLIISALVISGFLGYGVNWYLARYYPKYDASGYLQVNITRSIDPFLRTEQPVDSNGIELEVRTQVQILKSDALMSKAIRNDDVRETSWYKNFGADLEACRKNFKDNFSVSPVVDTRLIRVEFSSGVAKEARQILEQAVNEHILEQNKYTADRLKERFSLVDKMLASDQVLLETVQSELKDAARKIQQMGGSGFAGQIGILDMKKSQLMQDKGTTDRDYEDSRTTYDRIVQMLSRGEEPPQLPDFMDRDQALLQLRSQVESLESDYTRISAIYGPQAEIVVRLGKQREVMRDRLAEREAQQRADAKVRMTESLRVRVEDLGRKRDEQQKQLEELVSEMQSLNSEARLYDLNQKKEQQLLDRIRQAEDQRKLLDTVDRSANARAVEWVAVPEAPWQMAFPRLPITLSVALFLGLAVSVGLAFLRETMDTSIRSPRDIIRAGPMTLLGMVPDENDDPQSAGGRLPLIIFDTPHSLMAEQFRQVRTRLQHAASLDTTRSLLVTSPLPGDGKTTVAVNLAAGLALNGRRILLVDANFRRPELHHLFDLANDQGFSDVLASLDNFEHAVRETQVPNLSVLTTGARPANATELLESQLLIDFIERALEQYDHVIFDSGPLLMISETVALAPRVDGVVTVVRAKANSRGVLQRLVAELKRTKAEHLGVVLNGVRAQGGGYYAQAIKSYYEYNS